MVDTRDLTQSPTIKALQDATLPLAGLPAFLDQRLDAIDDTLALILAKLGSGGIVTPTPSPSFTNLPTIQSDGTPQVGEQLTGVDALTANLGPAVLTRAWLNGTTVLAIGATFTPNATGTYTFRNQLLLAGVPIATVSVDVVVAAATVTPTPPAFTRQPSIGTDGSPTVDEVVSFDFGEIAGDTIGVRQVRDAANNIIATVTTGSYRLESAGQIKLRVFAANTAGLFADSPLITVVAPEMGAITPPTIYFDSARAAGTNPPEVLFDLDGTALATDIIVGEVTNGGSTTSLPVQLSIAALTAQDFTYASFDNLAAGSFSMRTRIKREKDIDGNIVNPPVFSDWSNTLTDVLNAKALPPATTMWPTANGDRKNQYVKVLEVVEGGGDFRIAESRGTGGIEGVMATQNRTDARYWEHTVKGRSDGPTAPPAVRFGACSAAAVIGTNGTGDPAGMVVAGYAKGLTNPSVNDKLLCYYKPATSGANGRFVVWLNGVLFSDQAHSEQGPWTIYNSFKNFPDSLLLNTGQEPIATNLVTAIDPTAQRFN